MTYFLDTNTCIYFLNGKYQSVKEKLLSLPPDRIKIPVIVKAELLFGAFKSYRREETVEKVELFISPFEVVSYGDRAAYEYGTIRLALEISGNPIGPNDLIIAATTISENATLVTHNVSEFSRVSKLKFEDWVKL
jgi:tRNA(fMet)-specific endonuclease VapC